MGHMIAVINGEVINFAIEIRSDFFMSIISEISLLSSIFGGGHLFRHCKANVLQDRHNLNIVVYYKNRHLLLCSAHHNNSRPVV